MGETPIGQCEMGKWGHERQWAVTERQTANGKPLKVQRLTYARAG
jgi:hypothetical protein